MSSNKPAVSGVSADVRDIDTNAKGGKQTKIPYSVHLVDPVAILAVAEVCHEGADKYERDNWRLISEEDHINRVLVHLLAHLAGDTTDDHLAHATTRCLMALAKNRRPEFLGHMEGRK